MIGFPFQKDLFKGRIIDGERETERERDILPAVSLPI